MMSFSVKKILILFKVIILIFCLNCTQKKELTERLEKGEKSSEVKPQVKKVLSEKDLVLAAISTRKAYIGEKKYDLIEFQAPSDATYVEYEICPLDTEFKCISENPSCSGGGKKNVNKCFERFVQGKNKVFNTKFYYAMIGNIRVKAKACSAEPLICGPVLERFFKRKTDANPELSSLANERQFLLEEALKIEKKWVAALSKYQKDFEVCKQRGLAYSKWAEDKAELAQTVTSVLDDVLGIPGKMVKSVAYAAESATSELRKEIPFPQFATVKDYFGSKLKKGCLDAIGADSAVMLCQLAKMMVNLPLGMYMGALNPGHYLSVPMNAIMTLKCLWKANNEIAAEASSDPADQKVSENVSAFVKKAEAEVTEASKRNECVTTKPCLAEKALADAIDINRRLMLQIKEQLKQIDKEIAKRM